MRKGRRRRESERRGGAFCCERAGGRAKKEGALYPEASHEMAGSEISLRSLRFSLNPISFSLSSFTRRLSPEMGDILEDHVGLQTSS